MPAITSLDLSNAKLDVDHIAAIATSILPTATDRKGNTKDTISGAIHSIKAFNDRGAWASGTSYVVKDLVKVSSTWYVVVVPHTSSATFAEDLSTKWRVYQGVIAGDLSSDEGSSTIGFLQGGLNAIGRTVQDKLREVVSVTDYMTVEQRAAAKDSASTLDHTDAFVKAYNVSNTVIVPAGFYNVNGFNINKNNFTLIGVGYNQSILRATAAGALCIEAANTANVSGLKLKDIKIEGSVLAVGGIKLGSDDFYCAIPMLENVNVLDFSRTLPMAGFGIQLYKVQNVTIHNCWVYRNRYGIHHPNAGYATATKISGKSGYIGGNFIGVYIDGFYDDLYIDDVVIESNTRNGIAVTANAVRPDRGSNIFINGAYFESNGADSGSPISIEGGPGMYQVHVVVVERIYFAANSLPFINLNKVAATIRNCKLTPAQVRTTANCTVRFDSNKYPTGSNYLTEYRALLGNIMVNDMVDPNLATDLNQLNFFTSVTFPSVARTVTDRYTLDCYDEAVTGQWTPVPSGFTGTISSISGQYVKIGRIVHFEISISGNPLSTLWTTTLVSLPFVTAINTSCNIFNAGNGTSPGGAYIDSTVDAILLPTIAASNAVFLINGTYIADE